MCVVECEREVDDVFRFRFAFVLFRVVIYDRVFG